MLRAKIGPFGVKDLFTMVNLLSGVVAVGFVLRDQPRHAGFAVMTGFLLGDVVDGTVARRTGTANRFGAEFDSVTDHFVHVFVPGLVFFGVYEHAHHAVLGLVGVAALISAATLRHARFAAARFAALSLPLSATFVRSGAGYTIGCAVVVVLSALNLAPIPYMTHRGRRAMQPYVRAVVVALFLVVPVAFLVARRYTFDMVLLDMLWFAATGWFPVHPDERREFRAEYRRWSAELAR
jgi:phosphatidylserine synthase